MEHNITGYVGLDVHKDSIAVAVATPGRTAPRFVGTTGPRPTELTKALAHLGQPAQLHLAYEAGPCGYTLARGNAAHAWNPRRFYVGTHAVIPAFLTTKLRHTSPRSRTSVRNPLAPVDTRGPYQKL